MTEPMAKPTTITDSALVDHYRQIYRERMQGLPIVNQQLEVEAVGFRDFEEHRLGILITPWFMNLVLLPGNKDYEGFAQGTSMAWSVPGGGYEFTACRDDHLGTYFTAILFRTVADIPDQPTARAIAGEIMLQLFREPDATSGDGEKKTISRRALFSGTGAS